ncbi:MAG: arylsulfatase [Planctomycetota bacterium]|jgi:arylsulfatase A-like enzyme
MNRRELLSVMAGGVVGMGLPDPTMGRGKAGRGRRVNVIYIMADDMGYGDLGCYGQKRIKTPNIDKLAAEGTRFTQCYTGSTVCAPSRSVLMTGQHTGHTRVRGNSGIVGGVGSQRRVPLQAEDFTVAELFKRGGYATGITGKWGLGEPETTGVPNRQGFDEWFGYLNQRNAHSYYPPYLWKNEEKFTLEGNQNGKKGQYSHDLMTDFALDFLRRDRTEPFFLYLPYTIPHAKYEIPSTEPYSDESWPQNAKVHAAMITRLDGDVGKIMALLKDLGLDDNTLVFFCSDNGAANRWEGIFDSSGPLKGRKRDMYEGGIRTPMIARWPGKVPAGKVDERTVWYFADFLPTMADLIGEEAPDNIDGISVLPSILGKKQRTDDRFLYWEFFERGFKQAVRWRNYKAVRLGVGKPIELYNLKKDPAETTNIAEKTPKIVAKIENYLKTARTESKNWPVKK